MNRISINEIISSDKHVDHDVSVCGWVKSFRANRFIALNDGSCLKNIQCVIDFENANQEELKKISTGDESFIFFWSFVYKYLKKIKITKGIPKIKLSFISSIT